MKEKISFHNLSYHPQLLAMQREKKREMNAKRILSLFLNCKMIHELLLIITFHFENFHQNS